MSDFNIVEHAQVIGSDGAHVGTVDNVEGDRIKLTKNDDPHGSGQHHHFTALSDVASVEDGRVVLIVSGEQARATAASTF